MLVRQKTRASDESDSKYCLSLCASRNVASKHSAKVLDNEVIPLVLVMTSESGLSGWPEVLGVVLRIGF